MPVELNLREFVMMRCGKVENLTMNLDSGTKNLQGAWNYRLPLGSRGEYIRAYSTKDMNKETNMMWASDQSMQQLAQTAYNDGITWETFLDSNAVAKHGSYEFSLQSL